MSSTDEQNVPHEERKMDIPAFLARNKSLEQQTVDLLTEVRDLIRELVARTPVPNVSGRQGKSR